MRRLSVALSAAALLFAFAGAARAVQPVPAALGPAGSFQTTIPSAIVVAPTGGGSGVGAPVAADNPFPVLTAGVAYQLQSNASATSAQFLVVAPRTYVLNCIASSWNSASDQLQILGPDGTTWQNQGSALTANGTASVTLGAQTTVRMLVTGGPPAGVYCTLS